MLRKHENLGVVRYNSEEGADSVSSLNWPAGRCRSLQSADSLSHYHFRIYTHLSVDHQRPPIPCIHESIQHMRRLLVSPTPLDPFNAQKAPSSSSSLHPRRSA